MLLAREQHHVVVMLVVGRKAGIHDVRASSTDFANISHKVNAAIAAGGHAWLHVILTAAAFASHRC